MEVTAGVVAVLVASVIQAFQFVLSKALLKRNDPVALAIHSVWLGTLADLVFARGLVHAVAIAPLPATLAIVFLGVASTAIATITWAYALARVPAPYAASFLYLVPAVSIGVAWVWLGEVPAPLTIAGGALAIVGVAIVRSGDVLVRVFTRTALPARS
jgi:drug/metabolite transporter (DMT)-like permease